VHDPRKISADLAIAVAPTGTARPISPTSAPIPGQLPKKIKGQSPLDNKGGV